MRGYTEKYVEVARMIKELEERGIQIRVVSENTGRKKLYTVILGSDPVATRVDFKCLYAILRSLLTVTRWRAPAEPAGHRLPGD